MNYYSLPVIRCITCNKPIAHLFEQYQMLIDMGHDPSESFDIIDVKNYCCRRQFLAQKIPITKCIEGHMLDIKNFKPTPFTSYEGTDFLQNNIINEEHICIPIMIKPSTKIKRLNETLYLSYVAESTYLAQ